MTDPSPSPATGSPATGSLAERQRPGRAVTGMSAILLPFHDDGAIDWAGFEGHLQRTVDAGLVPAVNMDTGFGPFLDPATRTEVLARTQALLAGANPSASDRFVGGALVDDEPGAAFDADAYRRAAAAVVEAGGTPILFPSFGLAAVPEAGLVDAHAAALADVPRAFGFELGRMFHPAGRIWELATFEALLGLPALAGAKHSSLRRGPELDRLAVRDRVRPDFLVLTGNDLAIDQVVYGSDYLLGLSTFAPDGFAARDAAWAAGDEVRFWELNDLLQFLGQLAFRDPVPGYRHDAAMFLELRGQLGGSRTHPRSPERPASDRDLLAAVAARLDVLLAEPARPS